MGFDPYPGTLNLRLEPESIAKRKLLEGYDGFRRPPMSRGERSSCGARVFRAVINDSVEAGVVARLRTSAMAIIARCRWPPLSSKG